MKSLMICVTLVAAFFIGADSMARRQDMMTTAVTPDASTNNTDVSSNSTDTMTTVAAPVDGNNNMDDNSTTDAVTTSTPAPVTQAPPAAVTTTPIPVAACNKSLDKIEPVFAFTNEPGFRELSDNEMILIYELLAAGEGCKMSAFINAETTERIFRLLGDLRLKHVFTIVNFVASSLQNEGVVVPN